MKTILFLFLMLILLMPAHCVPYFYVALRSSNGLYQVGQTGSVTQVSISGISDAYIVKRYMEDKLLVSDHGGNRVLVLNQQGQTLRSTSLSGYTTGVGSTPDGTIYYSAWSYSNIWEWTPTDQVSTYAGSYSSIFGGVAITNVDGKNYVYAAHSTAVSKIDPVTKNYTTINIPGYSWPNLVSDTQGNVFTYGVYGSESTITKIAPNNATSTFYTANSGSTIAGIDYSIWDSKYYVLEENSSGQFNIYTTLDGTNKNLYLSNISGIASGTQAGFAVFDTEFVNIPEPGSLLLLALGMLFCKRKFF